MGRLGAVLGIGLGTFFTVGGIYGIFGKHRNNSLIEQRVYNRLQDNNNPTEQEIKLEYKIAHSIGSQIYKQQFGETSREKNANLSLGSLILRAGLIGSGLYSATRRDKVSS